jgi:hypothetical protein
VTPDEAGAAKVFLQFRDAVAHFHSVRTANSLLPKPVDPSAVRPRQAHYHVRQQKFPNRRERY